MKLSRNIINKCLFVGICSAVLVVVVVYGLMDFNSADERDDATVAKTQNSCSRCRLCAIIHNMKNDVIERKEIKRSGIIS